MNMLDPFQAQQDQGIRAHRRYLILLAATLYIPLGLVLELPGEWNFNHFAFYLGESAFLYLLWAISYVPALIPKDRELLSIGLTSGAVQSLLMNHVTHFDLSYALGGYIVSFGSMLIVGSTRVLLIYITTTLISLTNLSALWIDTDFPKVAYVLGLEVLVIWSHFTGLNRLALLDRMRKMQFELLQQSKVSSLGIMAGGIAHEINNPLTIIAIRLDQIQKLVPSEDVRGVIGSAQDAVRRVTGIVGALLSLVKEHKTEGTRALGSVIQDVMTISGERFEAAQIEIKTEIQNPELKVRNPEVSQILLNLVQNSYESLVRKGQPGWLAIRSHVSGDRLKIEVEDSGGISEDLKAMVFDPFFTTKDVGKGMGLGLTLSQDLANKIGGVLEIDPIGAKALFTLWLPIEEKLRADDGMEYEPRLNQ